MISERQKRREQSARDKAKAAAKKLPLPDDVENLLLLIDDLVDNWEGGDLAGAVNALRLEAEAIRGEGDADTSDLESET